MGNADLSRVEREILVLSGTYSCGKWLSNKEISERLNIPETQVKTILHQAYVKLRAHNRIKALKRALVNRGEVRISDFYSLDEIADIFSSFSPDLLQQIAYLVRNNLDYSDLEGKYRNVTRGSRKRGSILTKRERDVLICISQGLTNQETAKRLYMSTKSVSTFMYRVCLKLRARKRIDAVMLALRNREIKCTDLLPFNVLYQTIVTLGADNIEEVARILKQRLEQESGQYA